MSPLFSSTVFDPDANSVLSRSHLCTAVNSRLCELRIDYWIEEMGEVRNGDQKVRKHLFYEILYGRQAVFYEDFFKELFGLEGSKNLLENFVRCTI